MPSAITSLTLVGNEQQHQITLSEILYQGQGVYSCNIRIQSNGFSCHTAFNFDNDEYFLAKLKDVLVTQSGTAELFDLQSDNLVRIQAHNTDLLLVSGLILEQRPFAQSLEFAFATHYDKLERFTNEFGHMVQINN